jgi:hypothetical protein
MESEKVENPQRKHPPVDGKNKTPRLNGLSVHSLVEDSKSIK